MEEIPSLNVKTPTRDFQGQEKYRKPNTPPMIQDNFPVTDLIEMEVHELPDKEFNMIVLNMPSQLQDNSVKSEKQYLNKMKKSTRR